MHDHSGGDRGSPKSYLLCIGSRIANADEDTGEAEAGDDGLVHLGQGHVPPKGPAAWPTDAHHL